MVEKSAYVKYSQIWHKIKELLGAKFYTEPIKTINTLKLK